MDTRARILCVDDEPNVLDALRRTLHRTFDVTTAPGGEPGLAAIAAGPPFAVVVADMRMPGMNGAAFLARVRERAPDTVRVLLTGHADLADTIAAVNEGNIFRFLAKPCPPDTLLAALGAAVAQHRLVTAERVLLEQTLHGSVKLVTDLLALASPAAFGRATRLKQQVSRLADHLGGVPDRWQVEVAAMLSQIGGITLPAATAEKLYHGEALAAAEQEMVAALPRLAGQLLASIPRLEAVCDILRHQAARFDGAGAPPDQPRGARLPWGARALKIAVDFDLLETRGVAGAEAVQTLRGRAGCYDPDLLSAFGDMLGAGGAESEVLALRLHDVRTGMTFADDVTTRTGVLLIARGQEVTVSLLHRIRNFSDALGVREPIRMVVPRSAPAEHAARAHG
jgi:response regulator RpfG family c-di-GMP phosphodiesterase